MKTLVSASGVPTLFFADAVGAGEYAARETASRLALGLKAHGVMSLGCPSGRTARTTYAALPKQMTAEAIDLRALHVLLMDEYVEADGASWRCCADTAHFSCVGFGEREIRAVLNADVSPDHQMPRENLHAPEAKAPQRYDELINRLQGIDMFLLASGETDGHVAFNPRGTPLTAGTRVIALTAETRRDNLGTFPGFSQLAEVPTHGVSVGTATIAQHSRAAILLLLGAGKGEALRRLLLLRGYDKDWPASVVLACRDAQIVTDSAAVAAMRALG